MLNIKQLNKSIDSLSKKYIKSENRYKENFFRGYPHLAKIDTSETVIIDSASQLLIDTIVLPVIYNFETNDKLAIIENAQRAARTAKKKIIDYERELQTRQQIITKHEVAWHQKFKLSIACFIFFFIGAPLGAIIRKGGLGLPVVVSVIFFVLYHVVSMTGEKAVKTGEWNVEFGLWLSTIIVLPLGLFLTYKATTDAQLMDTDSWTKFFKKFDFKRKQIDA
jgi:lipopolysaccharide export system permease protein|tara:strand:- start:2574 stop:3239 length:666 start_codon:yes stop_codon:yes gene_type:complete